MTREDYGMLLAVAGVGVIYSVAFIIIAPFLIVGLGIAYLFAENPLPENLYVNRSR